MKSEDFGTVQNVRGAKGSRLRGSVRKTAVSRPRRVSSPKPATEHRHAMLAAAPVMALLEHIERRVSSDRRLGLETAEGQVFVAFAVALGNAVDEASRTDMWLTVAELQVMTGRPNATLTLWCRKHGIGVWADRRADGWHIYYPSFQTWYAAWQSSAAEEEA